MISLENIRTIFIVITFVLLLVFILKKNHSKRKNWALFYGFLWMLFTLPILNYIGVEIGFWNFVSKESPIKIPSDILFLWLFLWMLPFYIFKGKYMWILALALLWIDVLVMPILQEQGILILNENWLIGEVALIGFVFLPGYLWSKCSYDNTNLKWRALFQSITMTVFLMIIIPFIVIYYEKGIFSLKNISLLWVQIVFIIAFPSLIAVIDLVNKGKGTPFPYDKTERLVTSGVYAYIRNPIQWSFTVLFIPLAIYHQSYLLVLGLVVSLAYTIGVSNPQEFEDMQERFQQQWLNYKQNVPNWMFLWKPKQYPKATIYFKRDCDQCESIKEWFEHRKPLNLEIIYADFYKGETLQQATYTNEFGQEFKSVKAIAYAMEHINLGYASLGWFMRFPIINYIIQTIIDGFGFSEENRMC